LITRACTPTLHAQRQRENSEPRPNQALLAGILGRILRSHWQRRSGFNEPPIDDTRRDLLAFLRLGSHTAMCWRGLRKNCRRPSRAVLNHELRLPWTFVGSARYVTAARAQSTPLDTRCRSHDVQPIRREIRVTRCRQGTNSPALGSSIVRRRILSRRNRREHYGSQSWSAECGIPG
jgi:hypothetical protein